MTRFLQALRSICFDLVLYLCSALFLTLMLPFLLLPQRFYFFIQSAYGNLFHWMSKYVMGIDYQLNPPKQTNTRPVIYAIKHESAWDTMIFNRIFKNPVFVVKRDLLFMPILGFYIWAFNMITVSRRGDRQSLQSLIKQAKAALENGRDVIIFPEGTRVTHGEAPPIYPGIWFLYKQLNYPVIPVTLDSGKYWGRRALLKLSGCIQVSFHPPAPNDLPREEFLALVHKQINTPMAERASK